MNFVCWGIGKTLIIHKSSNSKSFFATHYKPGTSSKLKVHFKVKASTLFMSRLLSFKTNSSVVSVFNEIWNSSQNNRIVCEIRFWLEFPEAIRCVIFSVVSCDVLLYCSWIKYKSNLWFLFGFFIYCCLMIYSTKIWFCNWKLLSTKQNL